VRHPELILLALVVALVASGCSHARRERVLAVSISAAIPQPDPEDANVLGRRQWFVQPEIHVRLLRACSGLIFKSRAVARFDGNRFPRGKVAGETTGGTPEGRHAAGYVYRITDELAADPGDVVHDLATARCEGPNGRVAVGTASRSFRIPPASCNSGPVKAYLVRGNVVREDDNVEERPVPLLTGDLVWSPFAGLTIPRGGRVVLAAPECNGFRMTLFEGRYEAGSYERGGRGDSFFGTRIAGRGDRHAGGLSVPGRADVLPLDAPCGRHCPAGPSEYEVRSSGRRTTVRVSVGTVVLARGSQRVTVAADHQADVLCGTNGRCRVVGPRIFQPKEPWSTPAHVMRRQAVTSFIVPAGTRPRGRRLAPPFAEVKSKLLPAGGGAPAQIFVAWYRELRITGATRDEQGIRIWQAQPRGTETRWRLVLARPYQSGLLLGSWTADVSGDRHGDVLVAALQGSGGCGPWTVFATVRGRVETIFNRDTCEWNVRMRHGDVVVVRPVGPCPYREGSAHCFGGTRTLVERWNGKRLTVVRSSVVCSLKRLDPGSNCTRNPVR